MPKPQTTGSRTANERTYPTAGGNPADHPSWCERNSDWCGTIRTTTRPDGHTEIDDRLHSRTILRMTAAHADMTDVEVDVHMWIDRLDTEDQGQRSRVVVDSRWRDVQIPRTPEAVDEVLDGLTLPTLRTIAAKAATGGYAVTVAAFTAEQLAELAKAYSYAGELLAEAEVPIREG